MNKLRYVALLLFAVIIANAAFSCSNKKTNSEIESIFQEMTVKPDTDEETEETEETEGETEPPAFADHLYVVIPKDCSAELSLKAKELSDELSAQTGIASTLKYDNELASAPSDACEILIGPTDRLASKNAIDVLRTDDYVCRWDNGAVVICGRSDSSTFKAIDRFSSDILPNASKYSLMSADAGFENITKYNISRITLNGYDLYDYVIAYNEGDGAFAQEQAYIIRDVINERSGYLLEVIEQSKLTEEQGKRLILSVNDTAPRIQTVKSDVVISARDSYTLSLCVIDFINSISSPDENGVVAVGYSDARIVEERDNSFGITYYTVKGAGNNVLFASAELTSAIKSFDGGLLIAFNVDAAVYQRLTSNNNLPQGIEIQKASFGSETTLIVHKPSDVKELTYAVSEDGRVMTLNLKSASGESFAFSYVTDATVNDVNSLNDVNCGGAFFLAGYNGELDGEEYDFSHKDSASLDSGTVKYIFSSNERAEISKTQTVAENNTYNFRLFSRVSLTMCGELLDYALK